jgi:hypothetical protein
MKFNAPKEAGRTVAATVAAEVREKDGAKSQGSNATLDPVPDRREPLEGGRHSRSLVAPGRYVPSTVWRRAEPMETKSLGVSDA